MTGLDPTGPQDVNATDVQGQPQNIQQAAAQGVPMSHALMQLQQMNNALGDAEQQYRAMSNDDYRWTDKAVQGEGPGVPPLAQATGGGQAGLAQLGNELAERYGLAGRAPVVDASGNFNRLPNNAEEAIKFQYIAQAMANYRQEQQQKQAEASAQTGIGLVQNRARGSLATLQQGAYQSLAGIQGSYVDDIQNQTPNFSYFIEKELQDRALELQRKVTDFQKKQSQYSGIGTAIGIVVGAVIGGVGGAGIGATAGSSLGGALAAY